MNSKNFLKILAGCCAVALAGNVFAAPVTEADFSSYLPTGASPTTNYIAQFGGGTWTGIYEDDQWGNQPTADMNLEVLADIELYAKETIASNKIFFHIANIFTAIDADKIAKAPGTLQSNTEVMVGLQFDTVKTVVMATGMLTDGMSSVVNGMGQAQAAKYMDISILLDYVGDGTGAVAPDSQQGATLWWNVPTSMVPGTVAYDWVIQIHPDTAQADGMYELDPVVVCTPVL